MTAPIPPTSERRPGAAEAVAPPHAGDAASFLLSHPAPRRNESAKVLLGFGVLLLLGAVALNVGMWTRAREQFGRDGWARLEASADMRRDQIVYGLATFRREALSLVEEPLVAREAAGFLQGTLDEPRREAFETEILAAQRHFQFENVQVVGPGGDVRYEVAPSIPAERQRVRGLVARAARDGHDLIGDPIGDELLLAAPVTDANGAALGAIVVHTVDNRFFAPELARWPGLGEGSGAFLVRADGTNAVVLTDVAARSGLRPGQRVSLQSRDHLAATMAASGVESRTEFRDPDGRPVWAVTRALPTIGWGLVAIANRDEVLAGMRDTFRGLVLLDLALLIGLVAIAFVWRRLYVNALTEQEMELTEQHARRVQAVFDNAFDAIFTFDRFGRLRTANRSAEQLFGRTARELEGHPVSHFVRWSGKAAPSLPAPGAFGSGEAIDREGRRLPIEYSLGTVGSGEDMIYTAIARDVSDRVEAERRVRTFAEGLEGTNRRLEEANAQLEEASRLKSEFLANTSHELRTPLNGMIGFLQLVLDGMCDSKDEERDFLRQALQCSRHLLGLINDVLDIAKIEAGKLELEIQPLDVQHLFDEVATLTHVQAQQRDIQLTFDLALEDGVTARGDFGKVKQVLVNLVGNSLKFTHQGSVRVRATSHRDLGHVMFEVVDTGIGIPRSRQSVIFEKFVQADGSTTRRYGGTGLGLAISRSLIEMMGGIIGVQSEGEGKGTRLYFSLPVWREELAAPAPTPDRTVGGPTTGALVMVVEDDPVFRRFLEAVLQQHGYRTVLAADAEEGWARMQEFVPACVVMDYALSSGDNAALRTGWDLAHRMTSESLTRHIPVVFVTGFDGELQEKLKATAFARHPEHLVKPIDPAALVQRIQALVRDLPDRVVNVLIADDDPGVSTYIRKVLPRDRFHVEVTRNGEECLHALRTRSDAWDVLLLDLMMPEVSGYDVLREMTLAGLRPDLPVLVLTNFPEPRTEEEHRLLDRGLVVDVIAKSAVHGDPRMLPRVLDHHLGITRSADAGVPPTPADGLPEAA